MDPPLRATIGDASANIRAATGCRLRAANFSASNPCGGPWRNPDHTPCVAPQPWCCRVYARFVRFYRGVVCRDPFGPLPCAPPANNAIKCRLARSERFELPTPRFEVWCSIQLSYERGPRTIIASPQKSLRNAASRQVKHDQLIGDAA